MPRKNNRVEEEVFLPLIKDEKRSMPICPKFPHKTSFTSGYRAQVAIDEIKSRSSREKIPTRVYECEVIQGGCGFYHVTSQEEYEYAKKK
jgi:hypothetical protein